VRRGAVRRTHPRPGRGVLAAPQGASALDLRSGAARRRRARARRRWSHPRAGVGGEDPLALCIPDPRGRQQPAAGRAGGDAQGDLRLGVRGWGGGVRRENKGAACCDFGPDAPPLRKPRALLAQPFGRAVDEKRRREVGAASAAARAWTGPLAMSQATLDCPVCARRAQRAIVVREGRRARRGSARRLAAISLPPLAAAGRAGPRAGRSPGPADRPPAPFCHPSAPVRRPSAMTHLLWRGTRTQKTT
jgi:hypothetical protein